jgi:diguanylate cyclase (GGDEF)-like protein
MVQNGTSDLTCGGTTHNTERQKLVAFSNTIFIAGARLMTRKDSGIKEFSDLGGKNVVTFAASTSEKMLRKMNTQDHRRINIKVLTECVREMDTVARLGGDEFVVMLSELDPDKAISINQARVVAEKIRTSLALPYHLTVVTTGELVSNVKHHCSASIGVAMFVNHEASQNEILKWADTAMYLAKDAGRNTVRFYQADGQS